MSEDESSGDEPGNSDNLDGRLFLLGMMVEVPSNSGLAVCWRMESGE